MSISIGLLDFREERRIDEMFIASAFRIGSLYPEVVFGKDSNVEFLKSEVFEMTMEGDKLKEKALYLEKFKRAEERIKKAMEKDSSVDYAESIKNAAADIQKDLRDRRTILKQKLFNRHSDNKILKAANVGSAFAMERTGSKSQGPDSLNRHLLTMSPMKVMPWVTMDKSVDFMRKIKSSYTSLLNKYVSLDQQTEALFQISEQKKYSKDEQIANEAAKSFVQGEQPEYFNKILKKHKDMEMSPEMPTRSNKPKINL